MIGFYTESKSNFLLSKVKNPKLAKQGKLSHEWARSHMQILDNTITRLKKSKVNWHLSDQEVLDKKIDWAVKSIRSGEQILKQLLHS